MRVLIIGAGISGLFIAYELQNRGIRDITLIDAGYPGAGATLRNVACFRSSFTSPEHVVLMKYSIEKWLELRRTMGFDVRQAGYLWIARRPETLDAFKKLVDFHNSFGVPTRIIDPDEVSNIEPYINKKIIQGALHDPTAGKMALFTNFIKIYSEVRRRGARVITYTPVHGLRVSGYTVKSAKTAHGEIESDIFVIAAAEGSKQILKTINVDIPVEPIPRHPVVTEPYAEIIRSGLVIDWDTKGSPHITQTDHGSIIMARDVSDQPGQPLLSHRADAIKLITKPLSELFPVLKYLNISRYWMGYYDMTPDHHPIYGPVEPYENLYVACGFSGHGLMIAPATGRVISDWILDGRPSIHEAMNLTINRFRTGRLIKELAVVG